MKLNKSKSTDVINICFSNSEQYLDLLIVAIHSIQKSNPIHLFHFYLNFSSDNLDSKRRIEALITKGKNIVTFFEYNEIFPILHNMFKRIEHISVETYFKLFLPSILKVSKILYLDVDLIVVGDLADLYTHQLGTFSIAARTYDNSLKWVVERNLSNGLPEEHNYFNAGVLLLDLDLLRRNKYFEKAINLVLQDNNINDQDALNRIVKSDFSELQARYNWTLHQKDSKEEPVIIHFPGKYKPITFGYVHPYSTLYSKLANEVLLKNYKILDFKYLFYYRFKMLLWRILNTR